MSEFLEVAAITGIASSGPSSAPRSRRWNPGSAQHDLRIPWDVERNSFLVGIYLGEVDSLFGTKELGAPVDVPFINIGAETPA